MKHAVLLLALAGLGFTQAASGAMADPLETGFLSPPDSAKPHTWWHRMNGNITKEGITADLEAMKRVGLGGAQVFDVTDGIPAGPVDYMSPQWRELMKHTIAEANRLGLEICLHNCAGWSSSGGPWITPEYAMQKVVFSEKQFTGPAIYASDSLQPDAKAGFYRDIAVLAFPTPEGESKGKRFQIVGWEEKSGAKGPSKKNPELPPADMRTVQPGDIILPDKIIDLTGRKTWDVPVGNWTIVRFGYTPVGTKNHPAPAGGLGLECDKFNRAAAQLSWNNTVAKVIGDVGPLTGKTFNNVLIDSYEVGMQNWTPLMAEQFRKARGYDLLPYLPCLTGRVVQSLDCSERFLWDFRRTLADLYLEEYIGTFANLCHQNKLLLSCEPYGPGNFNHLEVGNLADIPMGEFWTAAPTRYGWTGRLAASSANANGRKFVGAEAFTSAPEAAWHGYPANLKAEGDHFFCEGINRFIFHTFVHQPWTNVLPGMTMGPHGMQFNRNNTWFEQSAAWLRYLTRCQYLLQEGRSVKDLCYLIGEDSPVGNTLPTRDELHPAPPQGFDYDWADARTVSKMSVKDGQIVLPEGMGYRALVLPGIRNMRPALAQKISELVKAGATVVGSRPTRSPSLENFPAADKEVKHFGEAVSEEPLDQTLSKIHLLPDAQFQSVTPSGKTDIDCLHRQVGTADLYFVSNQQDRPVTVEGTFRVSGREPELWHPDTGQMEAAPVCRQTLDGRTVVTMDLDQAGSVFVVFRKPTQGDQIAAFSRNGHPAPASDLQQQDGTLAVNTPESGDYAVQTVRGKSLVAKVPSIPAPWVMPGPWQVKFPPGWGAPAEIRLENLTSWTQYELPDVKYFSGTATYIKDFQAPKVAAPQTLLDLGRVEVMAEVRLNGTNLGVLWKPPYEVDITSALHPGMNHLEIRVVNLWNNRLIGDLALPSDESFEGQDARRGMSIAALPKWLTDNEPKPNRTRKTFITWQHFRKDSPLAESGLLGPVRLVFKQNVPLQPRSN